MKKTWKECVSDDIGKMQVRREDAQEMLELCETGASR
jgi:hypothetical protein